MARYRVRFLIKNIQTKKTGGCHYFVIGLIEDKPYTGIINVNPFRGGGRRGWGVPGLAPQFPPE